MYKRRLGGVGWGVDSVRLHNIRLHGKISQLCGLSSSDFNLEHFTSYVTHPQNSISHKEPNGFTTNIIRPVGYFKVFLKWRGLMSAATQGCQPTSQAGVRHVGVNVCCAAMPSSVAANPSSVYTSCLPLTRLCFC